MSYLPRDYVSTPEGLLFAVVAAGLEEDRVLGCLRYAPQDGQLRKLDSDEAEGLLRKRYPRYRFFSAQRDVWLHAVPADAVLQHFQPRQRVWELTTMDGELHPLAARLLRLLDVFAAAGLPPAEFGVTGSLLVGAQRPGSDLDLVIYDRELFARVRQQLPGLVQQRRLEDLSLADWHEAYQRRGCSLTLEEYLWHERRKWNKALFEGTKFDISLVCPMAEDGRWRKQEICCRQLRVTDDRFAYDYPARLGVDEDGIVEIASYTATYTGQASCGECVEVCGWLEQAPSGRRRIVVGSDREARGQYIRVRHS